MGLQDKVSMAVQDLVARMRRDAIAYSICAICGIAALVLAIWASVLALIPLVGLVYAPLVVAGFFALVIILTMLWLQRAHARPSTPSAMPFAGVQGDTTQRQAQFAQIAMIVEAVLLGYSMSRRR
jgi:hypothetical protein